MRPLRRFVGNDLDDAGVAQSPQASSGPTALGPMLMGVAVRASDDADQPLVTAPARTPRRILRRPLQAGQQRSVRHLEPGGQRLRRPGDQPLEGPLVPGDVPFRGRLLHHHLLAGGLFEAKAEVLDDVRGRLGHHRALFVEALAPRSPGDLVKLADAENPALLAVELAELGEEHRPDGDVHAHAQGVGPAHHLQQSLLGQPLDQQPITGQEARRGGSRCRGARSAGSPCRRACRRRRSSAPPSAPLSRPLTTCRRSSGSAPRRPPPVA